MRRETCFFVLLCIFLAEGGEGRGARTRDTELCTEQICNRATETLKVPQTCLRSNICVRKIIKKAKKIIKGSNSANQDSRADEEVKTENEDLRSKVKELETINTNFLEQISVLMDELNESKRRNQDLTKRMYLLEADIANRVYNISQAEEQIQDLQEQVGRLPSEKNESELKIDLEKCKESMNTFARVNADCKNKIGELNQCLRENSKLIAQNTEAAVTPQDKVSSSPESDHLRISINPQEKVKDQLILQLREDLETCLWTKPNQIRSEEQTADEDCASPCTITRGVGVVNQKFEDLKSGDVIRNLTEQNQKLQQEVRDLRSDRTKSGPSIEQSNPEISSAEKKTLVQIYENESIEKDGDERFAKIADTVTKVVDIVKLFEKSDKLPDRFKTSGKK